MVTGIAGGAGEFGHISIDPSGDLCRCGNRGCLELYASFNGPLEQMARLLQRRVSTDDVILMADGTWKDPDAVSDDARADNVVLEVEFGEVAGELAGQGALVALALINHLEVNEQVLYARMIDIEESTLIT